MIVACTRCQAKFRVADEKVGPRGARVRCSRCENLFVVRLEEAPSPKVELNDPFTTPPAPSEAPFPATERTVTPFAAESIATAGADLTSEKPGTSPVSLEAPLGRPQPPYLLADDLESPFSAAQVPTSVGSHSPGARELLDFGAQFDTDSPDEKAETGLALEEREPGQGPSVWGHSPDDEATSRISLALAEERSMSGLSLSGLEFDIEPTPRNPPPALPGKSVPAAAQPAAKDARPVSGGAPEASPAAQAVAKIPYLRRASRLRTVMRAAVFMTLAIFAAMTFFVWRSSGRLEPGAMRPSAILSVLRGHSTGTFSVLEVTSGAYERAQGPPLLFVRGRAISHAPASVRALRVVVEVVRGGEVIARGQGLAGGLPSAEELYGVTDGLALTALTALVERRIPPVVNPGEPVPFLVAIADYPRDLENAALRVEVKEGTPGSAP